MSNFPMNIPVKLKVWQQGQVIDYKHGYRLVAINLSHEPVNNGIYTMAYGTLLTPDGEFDTMHEGAYVLDEESTNGD